MLTTSEYNKTEQDIPSSLSVLAVSEDVLQKIESEKHEISQKSEEVQAIIDRMPTYWVKWVTLL